MELSGFVQDVGGEVVESVPGRIRVRLGGRSAYQNSDSGPLSWLGLGRKAPQIDMELHLQQVGDRTNLLHITVAMRPTRKNAATDPSWRARCTQVFCDLRGYLMGQTEAVSDSVL